MELYYFSKNKIEKTLNMPVEEFLTDDVFYKNMGYNEYSCLVGNIGCIDYKFSGFEMGYSFDKATIYTNGDYFPCEAKTFTKNDVLDVLVKVKDKMFEYGKATAESGGRGVDKELYKKDYSFPYYENLLMCIRWLKGLDEDDEIILIAI